jgi:hypothetical protein
MKEYNIEKVSNAAIVEDKWLIMCRILLNTSSARYILHHTALKDSTL